MKFDEDGVDQLLPPSNSSPDIDIDCRDAGRSRAAMKASGFTMVELVVTMMIIGILAVAVIPRFTQIQTFEARGFHDQALSMVRYAQKVAIAQRAAVFVNADAASNTLCLTYVVDANCSNPVGVLNPADGASFSKTAPAGVTLTSSAASFSFSGLGKPAPDAAVTINVIGDGVTRPITVERETGYVH